jgi:hypothetical protein
MPHILNKYSATLVKVFMLYKLVSPKDTSPVAVFDVKQLCWRHSASLNFNWCRLAACCNARVASTSNTGNQHGMAIEIVSNLCILFIGVQHV